MTLDNEAFADACHRLQQAVEASGYRPDMVLSIVTGGLYVGNGMFAGASEHNSEAANNVA